MGSGDLKSDSHEFMANVLPIEPFLQSSFNLFLINY